MIAVAEAAAQPAPGMFSFLKHGVVISARRCGLFLMVFALNVALSTALLTVKILVAPPEESGGYSARIEDDAMLKEGKHAEFSYSRVCHFLAAYLVLYLAVGLVKKVATASAAVVACSGEHHTFGSFLRKVRSNLLGGSATVAFGHVLRTACATAIAASILALPALVYWGYSLKLFLLDALFSVLAFQFYFYLDVVCTMAIVASVAAEPRRGRHGALGAVARAWRAMAGTSGRAFLYAVVTLALGMDFRSVSNLAVSRLPHGMDKLQVSMVDAGIKYVLHFVVEVFSVVAITAYYFDCRNRKEDKAGHTD